MYHEFLQTGDVVPGTYSEDGRRLTSGATPDDAATIQRKRDLMASSATRGGGSILEIKTKKRGKAPKPLKAAKRNVVARNGDAAPLSPTITQAEVDLEQTTISPITAGPTIVYLHNKLGKIKMKVEAVLENDMAYCLVFAHEDDVIITPNAGETLTFIDEHGDGHSVYYANTTFNWTDGCKQLMILFKRDEE